MAVTLKVQPNDGSDGWSVISHATPDDPTSSSPPRSWVADNLIVGSFAHNVDADYDGKYFQDSGQLYLSGVKLTFRSTTLKIPDFECRF